MSMYTKCPACRSEIAFEPPANMADLPDDYKHRIKCPSCGVTIGVKLNKIDRQATYNDAPIENTAFEGVDQVEEPETVPARSVAVQKKAGTGRNILMMIIALAFIVLDVIGYLYAKGTIKLDPEKSLGLGIFAGLTNWDLLVNEIDIFKIAFEGDFLYGFVHLVVPMLLFTFSCVTFLTALISACGKKYSRAFNLIWALIMLALGVVMLFGDIIAPFDEAPKIGDFFKEIIDSKLYAAFFPAILGFLQTLFALIFLKSLKKKTN